MPAPYPLSADIALEGQWASDRTGAVEAADQVCDFETAELTSRLIVTLGDLSAEVEIVTFASRTHPTLVCQEISLAVSGACTLGLRLDTGLDGVRGRNLERRLDTPGEDAPICDGSLLWESEGGLGQCGLALKTTAPEDADSSQTLSDTGGPIATTYRLKARKGRRYRLTQLASNGRFQQTLEYRLDKVPGGVASGPFFANMAGFLTGLLTGMPGLRITSRDPETWPARPVVLPEGWRTIECDRLWVRGKPTRLRARHGAAKAELTAAR